MMQNPSIWKLYIALIFFVFQHLGSSLAVLSRNKSNILYIEGLILFINSRTLYTILRSWLQQCLCACVCTNAHKDLVSPVLFAGFLFCFVFIVVLSGKV